jgi:hypothetical protein
MSACHLARDLTAGQLGKRRSIRHRSDLHSDAHDRGD